MMSTTVALIFLLYLCYLQSKIFYFCNTELLLSPGEGIYPIGQGNGG